MAESFLHGVEVLEIDAGPRPIQTVRSSVIGIVGTAPRADASVFPLNTPVLVTRRSEAAALLDAEEGDDGTLPSALDAIFDQAGAAVVVVRVEEDADEATELANVVGGVNSGTDEYEGVHALLAAESILGVAPRILIAPGFTHQRPEDSEDPGTYLANPVVAELLGVAQRLRAVIVADGPNGTDADAIAYAEDFGSDRVYVVDPWVKDTSGTPRPASAAVAGLIARTDNERGFWWSPSNQTLNGVIGTGRAVDFALGDANSRANILNENKIATIIRHDGFRLWGNRTLSSDPKFAFLSVRRTADIINDSILRAHMWAVDRNITKTYVEDVTESVNAYLRHLTSIGAIIGGQCWADPDLNTPENIAAGRVYFNVEFTPPYPAERVTFRSQLVNDYLEEIV